MKKSSKTKNKKLLSWLRFFAAETPEEFERASAENPMVAKAYKRLKELSQDEDLRVRYEAEIEKQKNLDGNAILIKITIPR